MLIVDIPLKLICSDLIFKLIILEVEFPVLMLYEVFIFVLVTLFVNARKYLRGKFFFGLWFHHGGEGVT
jgi:hypothetical protein